MQKNKITRGTTPTLNFILPFEAADVTAFYLTFTQIEQSRAVLEKNIAECTLSAYTVCVPLTQRDTLCLTAGECAVQIRLTAHGQCYASPVFELGVEEILKNEEI